ncbi:putative lipid-binding transport protein (Tim44 family) [Paucimonas lemoignei]|uniref:Putative lipid-binding transport protein (Tim44 family) n=1 Tax=Paucimonas lemoignei TaxID=29443 RepID=A0A4R3HW41_PAULE|nr:Tim44-like domain-containing protein [Paucimonas lemoignei]TCS36994.1 putative lipid-binding transport protein (Tim44 family) [Paucimonas lemoignei]
MKKCLNAVLVVAALGASSLHAESSLPHESEGLWEALRHHPPLMIVVLAGLVLLLGLAIVLWRRAAGRGEPPVFENTYDSGFDTIMPAQRRDRPVRTLAANTDGPRTDTVVAPWSVPADFDVPRFLRKSKAAFIRLQAAWDQADLQDIRRFTTRELFAEFCRQLKDRGGVPNVTEVVTLGAELHSVETVDEYYVAKVKFSGVIREDIDAPEAPFSEVWQLSKPLDGHRSWIVAGIEQY